MVARQVQAGVRGADRREGERGDEDGDGDGGPDRGGERARDVGVVREEDGDPGAEDVDAEVDGEGVGEEAELLGVEVLVPDPELGVSTENLRENNLVRLSYSMAREGNSCID